MEMKTDFISSGMAVDSKKLMRLGDFKNESKPDCNLSGFESLYGTISGWSGFEGADSHRGKCRQQYFENAGSFCISWIVCSIEIMGGRIAT